MQIHVQRGEEELGIFTPEETTKHLTEGRLLETDLAWYEGLNDWAPLGELCKQFGETKVTSGSGKPAQKTEEPAIFGQGRYQREKVLGKGGQGEVWLAQDLQLERQVAIKQVNEQFAPGTMAYQSLKDEVQKSLELTHPNITRIYDLVDVPGEPPFIAMEYLEGEDLYIKMGNEEGGHFFWGEIEPYILSLCDALEYAHGQGMVHRDLKPANLIITDSGELKLTDMGIAEPAKDPDDSSATENFITGTPHYWSPQQSQGIKPQATDDIYSLGATLYHLLTGRTPFLGENEEEITKQHLTKTPDDLQQALKVGGHATKIPAHINQLVLKCLAKDPTGRPQGAGTIRKWIRAKGDPLVRKQKRMALVSGVLGVMTLVMGAVAIWAWNQQMEADEQKEIAETKQQQAVHAREGEIKERKKLEMELEKAQAAKLVLGKGAERIKKLEGQPEVEAPMQNILGQSYFSLGFYDEALAHHKRALELRLKLVGPKNPAVAQSYNNIGLVCEKMGEYDQALKNYQNSLGILLDQDGEFYLLGAAANYNNIGGVHDAKGAYDTALEYYEKALAIWNKKTDENHSDVFRCYNNIGLVHQHKGNQDEAIKFFKKALDISSKIPDANPLYLAQNEPVRLPKQIFDHTDNPAKPNESKLGEGGKKDEDWSALRLARIRLKSEIEFRRNDWANLAKSPPIYSPNHRQRNSLQYYDYGQLYQQYYAQQLLMQRYLLAQQIRKAKENQMVLRPAFIPEVAHTYWNIGVAWKTKKEWTKAEASLKEAYAIFLQTLGEQHQDTKKCKAELDQLTKEIKANPKPPAQPATSKK